MAVELGSRSKGARRGQEEEKILEEAHGRVVEACVKRSPQKICVQGAEELGRSDEGYGGIGR